MLPRFLLRLPYGDEHGAGQVVQLRGGRRSASTTRTAGATRSFAFATRLADSFAKYRWCPNIIGPQAGGTVENLPLHQYEAMGEIQTKIPTEIMLTERREFELSEEGFIGLTYRKDSRQRLLLLGQLGAEAEDFGSSAGGPRRRDELPPRHAAPVHVHHARASRTT